MRSKTVAGKKITVEYLGQRLGRPQYAWSVGAVKGNDLNGPMGGRLDEKRELAALLGFLAAAGESWSYAGRKGENVHLFPEAVTVWASQHIDELAMAEEEIDGRARHRSGLLGRTGDRAARRRGAR
jgi:hypothetical protein